MSQSPGPRRTKRAAQTPGWSTALGPRRSGRQALQHYIVRGARRELNLHSLLAELDFSCMMPASSAAALFATEPARVLQYM